MRNDLERRTSEWVLDTLMRHIADHFSSEAVELVRCAGVRVLRAGESLSELPAGLCLPTGIPLDLSAEDLSIRVRGVEIQLPQRLSFDGFDATSTPGWLRAGGGALIPAWNLMAACGDLLAGLSEQEGFDSHGRARTDQSERVRTGRHLSPTVNDAAYLLVLGAAAQSGLSSRWVEDQVLPPVIHLSHDCDNLRDSSVWLQVARLKRSVRRPGRWALDAKQLRFVGEAALGLRDNPASDIGELPQLESTYGFWSRFYFINGQRGRYGARSRDSVTFSAAASIDSPHEVGLHYNYDTHLSVARLSRQRQELETGTGRKIVAGRAHYLRFDMTDSPPVWTAAGIRLDESIGYPDRCGFRVGLGGVFRPLGPDGVALPIACIPLIAMDVAMAVVDPVNPAKPVCELLDRVALVGGAAGILFHPGHLASDEFPQFRGAYQEILQHAAGLGARQQTTSEVLANHGIDY